MGKSGYRFSSSITRPLKNQRMMMFAIKRHHALQTALQTKPSSQQRFLMAVQTQRLHGHHDEFREPVHGIHQDHIRHPFASFHVLHYGFFVRRFAHHRHGYVTGVQSHKIRGAQLGLLDRIPEDLLNFRAMVDRNTLESSRVFVSDMVAAGDCCPAPCWMRAARAVSASRPLWLRNCLMPRASRAAAFDPALLPLELRLRPA